MGRSPRENYHDKATSSFSISSSLTPIQLQRVNDIFHEMYGYHFVSSTNIDDDTTTTGTSPGSIKDHPENPTSDENQNDDIGIIIKNDPTATTPSSSFSSSSSLSLPPPEWLRNVMGNNIKHTQRVWNQLSTPRQHELLHNVRRWDHHSSNTLQQKSTKKRMYENDIMMSSSSSSYPKQKRMNQDTFHTGAEHKIKTIPSNPASTTTPSYTDTVTTAVTTTNTNTTASGNTTTTKPTTQPNMPTTDTSSSQTTTKSNLSSLLQQLDGSKKITTITKTALDWEQYKDQNAMKDTLEQQATSTTAYLPKQEFLQRVDQRKYQQEKQQRLYEQGKGNK